GEGPRRGDPATPVGPNPLRLGRADPGGPRHPMSDATPAPTPVVVDASVGLKWYVTELHSGEAARLLGAEFEPHVPSHFYVELASALWKKVMLRGELTEDQARDVRGAVDEVPVVSHSTAGLLDEAFEIALVTRRPVYDCLYIALAERLGCVVVTPPTGSSTTRHGAARTPPGFTVSVTASDEFRLLPRQESSSQTANHGTTPLYGRELPPGRTRKGEVDSGSLFRAFRWIPWLISDFSGAAIGCCWTESAVRICADLGCRG